MSSQHPISLFHAVRGTPQFRHFQRAIQQGHYLHRMPDPRTSYELFMVIVHGEWAGALVFGRPEATRCAEWYGSLTDVEAGRCEVTRWQVLNLARVYLEPNWQAGGRFCTPEFVPGYTDRKGRFRSTLASAVLAEGVRVIGFEYLRRRPPCFLDEPYVIRWLLSYCDTAKHRGTIYAAAGWELYRTNDRGLQTWRTPLPGLTPAQDAQVCEVSTVDPRARGYRARRDQMSLGL